MHPLNVIRCLVVVSGLLYSASCAPSTPANHNFASPNTNTSSSTQQPNELKPTTNSTEEAEANTALEIVSDLADHHSSGPRFLADTVTDGDLSDNEAFYIGAVLLVNAFVFFGVVFYLLTPWTRMCSWFGNCKYNATGHGYYPAGLGHSLDDAARMFTSFNMFDQRAKRSSSEYFEPLLKFLAEAYDQYDRDPPTKGKTM